MALTGGGGGLCGVVGTWGCLVSGQVASARKGVCF